MKAAVYTAAAVQMTAVVHMAAENQVPAFDYFTQV